MNRRQLEIQMHHKPNKKFLYVIRNSSTGAYLCDIKLRRRIFPTYTAAETEAKRLNLNSLSYETEVIIKG